MIEAYPCPEDSGAQHGQAKDFSMPRCAAGTIKGSLCTTLLQGQLKDLSAHAVLQGQLKDLSLPRCAAETIKGPLPATLCCRDN